MGARWVRYAIDAWVLGVIAANVGCEDVESANIKTNGMYADFAVTGKANGQSEVVASLRVGGGLSNTYVELSSGDVLTGRSGSEMHTLGHHSSLNVHTYSATFAGNAEDQAFAIAFEREDDESAPDSSTTLPAPFTITAPAAGARISRGEDLTFTWTPASSGDRMLASIDGTCTFLETPDISGDPGTFTFPAGSITAPMSREGETCDVTLTVRRRRSGSVDPAFGEGGRFDATQERSVTFTSTP